MSGKNQHFIPQFLQRGFIHIEEANKGFSKPAKSTKNKQAQVWIFEKESQPYITNTKNKGAERFFYGSEGSKLDRTITDAETKYSKIVGLLREKTSTTSVDYPLIPELVIHLSVRTKHFRDSVEDLSSSALNMIQKMFNSPENLTQIWLNDLRKNPNNFIDKLDKRISSLPSVQQIEIKEKIQKNPNIIIESIKGVLASTPSIYAAYMQGISSVKNELPNISKNAHVKYLTESVIPEKRVEQLRTLNWFLSVQPLGSYILGDAGLLYYSSSNQYRPILAVDEDLQHVLLPISSQHLLIGSTVNSLMRIPDVELINQFSAALSKNFFIASQNTERERLYAQKIGTKNSVLSKAQFSIIEDDLRVMWIG